MHREARILSKQGAETLTRFNWLRIGSNKDMGMIPWDPYKEVNLDNGLK
jgi:hypothetical protein